MSEQAFEARSGDALPRGPRDQTSALTALVQRLLDKLRSGEIAADGRLPAERELVEILGVGRSRVREALKALDLLGLVDIRVGDGTYVRRSASQLLPNVVEWGLFLATPQAMDLVDARLHIEVALARMAAERATVDDLREIRARLDAMRESESADEFSEADVAFHLAVAAAAHNQVLGDMLVSIRALLRSWVMRVLRQLDDVDRPLAEHVEIADAIASGDPEAAGAAMVRHMTDVTEVLRRSIREEQGLTPA